MNKSSKFNKAHKDVLHYNDESDYKHHLWVISRELYTKQEALEKFHNDCWRDDIGLNDVKEWIVRFQIWYDLEFPDWAWVIQNTVWKRDNLDKEVWIVRWLLPRYRD